MIDLAKIIQGKKLTETEQNILAYIVENIDTVLAKGVRTVAKENYTSPATVMRLTKKLGYNGFIDLYYHLEPLVKGTPSREKQSTSYHYPDVWQYNSLEEIEKFARLMRKSKEKNIFIYATGFSGIIAEYMYKKFLVNRQRTLFASGMDSIGILENNKEMAGIFLTITKSGETIQVIEKMRYFKEHGIPVVTFTSDTDNKAAQLADIVFRIPDQQKLDDRNIQGNFFFAQVLLLFEMIMKQYHDF